MNKKVFLIEGILQIFIGVGAVIYGLLLASYPDGSKAGLPLELLSGSPFANYLIPGILLLLVNGVGNVVSSILSFSRHKYAGYAGMFFGVALIIWIIVQIILIGYANLLQPFYLSLGIIELLLGIIMYKQ